MSFKKAIASGKEHRKEYRGSKRFDKTCRCHGGCSYCLGNRLHSTKVRVATAEEEILSWRNIEDSVQFKKGYNDYMNDLSLRQNIYEYEQEETDWKMLYSSDYVEGIRQARDLLMLKYESEIEVILGA